MLFLKFFVVIATLPFVLPGVALGILMAFLAAGYMAGVNLVTKLGEWL